MLATGEALHRTQQVKHGFHLSSPKPINRGIVQGSGLGLTFHIIIEGDFKALSNTNLLCKYADDTKLLVPEITDVDINDEFNNVLKWADLIGKIDAYLCKANRWGDNGNSS